MKAVFKFLQENDARFVEDLCAYTRFASVSAQEKHRNDLTACAHWIAQRAISVGLQTLTHPTPGNPIVTARTPNWDESKPTFLVYGHYDVQPAEPFELWKSPPFEPKREGRKIFARGASDCGRP